MNKQIAITTSSFGQTGRQPLDLLEQAGIGYQLNPHGRKIKPEETLTLLDRVAGVVAGTEKYSRDILVQLPDLKVISRVGTGMDAIDHAAAAELGITVVNTPDAHVDGVAELTLGGILSMLRQTAQAHARLQSGAWKKPMGRLLRGKSVGIIGLGRTGKALVQLLEPFAVKVLAYDLYPDADFAAKYGVRYVDMDGLLAESDIVSLHVFFSDDNRDLLDAGRLAQMKPGAYLVNCARGGLVDETALFDLLQSGHLAGAYLDTFAQEPYQGPLCQLDNVVLTPHIGSYAAECRLRMETEAVENLLSALGAAPPPPG